VHPENLKIDDEFESLLPPMSDEEKLELGKSIARDGFLDPWVSWNGILVEGHNRYRLWKQFHELDTDRRPTIVEKEFKDRDAVKEWIVRHQLGRRNLTDAQRAAVALRLKPVLQEKAKANQSAAGGDKSKKGKKSLSPELAEPIDVRNELAEVAGVSHGTLSKVETVMAEGDDATKAAMLSPKSDPKHVSISKAYESVKTPAADPSAKPVRERSQAIGFAKCAINELLKIEWEDPKRMEALKKVSDWVAKAIKQEVPF